MELQELEVEALKLSPNSRARLAEKLMQSLDAISDEEIDRLWAEEALRRHEELINGSANSRPASDVFRDAKSRLVEHKTLLK